MAYYILCIEVFYWYVSLIAKIVLKVPFSLLFDKNKLRQSQYLI